MSWRLTDDGKCLLHDDGRAVRVGWTWVYGDKLVVVRAVRMPQGHAYVEWAPVESPNDYGAMPADEFVAKYHVGRALQA